MNRQKFEVDMRITIRPAREPGTGYRNGDQLTLEDVVQLGEHTLTEMLTLMGGLDAAIRSVDPIQAAARVGHDGCRPGEPCVAP